MPRIDSLSDPHRELRDILRRLRNLETATPLNHASIGRNGLRVHSGGAITIENGGLKITGTAEVIGELIGNGTLTWTGTANLDGPVHIDGATDINGTLAVKGATTLTNNLTLTAGGKLTMGSLTISPTAGGGDPGLGSTGTLGIDATTLIALTAPSTIVSGTLSAGDLYCSLTPTTSPANVYSSPLTGHFQLVSSAARFKLDPQPMTLPDSLLAVPVKDWIDRGANDRGEPAVRVPGVIAEEVAAAGGESFVSYDADGEIQGVSYDRLALARTEILARKLEAALAQITELRRELFR